MELAGRKDYIRVANYGVMIPRKKGRYYINDKIYVKDVYEIAHFYYATNEETGIDYHYQKNEFVFQEIIY